MMRGGTIVTTFLFSITFLKIKVQPKMIIGSALALIGVLIVGVSSLMFSGGSSSADSVRFLPYLGQTDLGLYLAHCFSIF